MLSGLIGHKDYVRVLQALRSRGELRFGQLETILALNPVQIDRALKFLRKEGLVKAQALPSTKQQLEYRLAPRGAAFLEAFDSFAGELYRRRGEIGSSVVAEFRALYQPAEALRPEPAVKIDRVIKIRQLPESGSGLGRNYLAACLALSPNERVARMRSHSRRIILLNPANPRSPHIDRRFLRIGPMGRKKDSLDLNALGIKKRLPREKR